MRLFTDITKTLGVVIVAGATFTVATDLISQPDTLSVWLGVLLLAAMVNITGYFAFRKLT